MTSTSIALESIQRHIPEHFQALARAHPVALSVSAASAFAGIWWVASDYAAYKALGRGGTPYNMFGWLIMRTVGLFSIPQRRIRDTTALKKMARETTRVKTLNLPKRVGAPPEVRGIAPQRQISQRGDEVFGDNVNKYFHTLVAAYPDILFVARSLNEGGTTDALYIQPTLTSGPTHDAHRLSEPRRENEIAHVHPIDRALHVPLSLPDCVEVLERGWGALHRLAGAFGEAVPSTLTLIYSPRSADEVEVVKAIIRASLEFKTGRKFSA